METSITQPEQIEIDQVELDTYMEKIKTEQNLWLAIIGGSIVWILWSIIWAAITVETGYQIGYMALFIWLWVGYTFRFLGKWRDKIFGIISATIAFLSCILGNIFTILAFAAQWADMGTIDFLQSIDYTMIPSIMVSTFEPIDLVFYILAIYTGYQSSFRVISYNEIIMNIKK